MSLRVLYYGVMVLNNWGTEMVIKIHLSSLFFFFFSFFCSFFSLSLSLWTCFRCLVNFLWQLAEKTLISSLLFILLLFIITRYSYVPLSLLLFALFPLSFTTCSPLHFPPPSYLFLLHFHSLLFLLFITLAVSLDYSRYFPYYSLSSSLLFT